MDRRDFIKKSFIAGATATAFMSIGEAGKTLADTITAHNKHNSLVTLTGNDPVVMFEKGIASFGGMKTFVKKNQTVVVKPNIGWDVAPERAANTNPELVNKIVEHCFRAGAKDVFVLDNTYDNWARCYKNSGIDRAVLSAGGKMIPANEEKYYREVSIPYGKQLKSAKVHEAVLDAGVFINVPVLKMNYSTRLSIAMQNLMGVVWDRNYWYRNDVHQCIADFATFKVPALNIIDAFAVVKTNGPKSLSMDDVIRMNTQIISTDILAADMAAAKLFGFAPEQIGYIRKAEQNLQN